ncbi:hypothetical protein FQA39_LY13234 [Lamprigera yunnana]|nr:hypothetical protein FQA39_LY13234 [Lamprigera yunnana]
MADIVPKGTIVINLTAADKSKVVDIVTILDQIFKTVPSTTLQKDQKDITNDNVKYTNSTCMYSQITLRDYDEKILRNNTSLFEEMQVSISANTCNSNTDDGNVLVSCEQLPSHSSNGNMSVLSSNNQQCNVPVKPNPIRSSTQINATKKKCNFTISAHNQGRNLTNLTGTSSCSNIRSKYTSNKLNTTPSLKNILLLSDSYGRMICNKLNKYKHNNNSRFTSIFRPNANYGQVIKNISSLAAKLGIGDSFIVLAGSKDIENKESSNIFSHIDACKHYCNISNVNFILTTIPYRYDTCAYLNNKILQTNNKLIQYARWHNLTILDINRPLNRSYYTYQGLQLNEYGKDVLSTFIINFLHKLLQIGNILTEVTVAAPLLYNNIDHTTQTVTNNNDFLF